MRYAKLRSILAVTALVPLVLTAAGCGGLGCPTTGYEDGYAAAQAYSQMYYALGSFDPYTSPNVPSIGSIIMQFPSYYRAPEGLDCPDYNAQFAAGMIDGMLHAWAAMVQSSAQGMRVTFQEGTRGDEPLRTSRR